MPRPATPGVVLAGDRWRSGPMLVGRTRLSRLRGLGAVPPGWGALLRTRSVHTIGARGPVAAFGIGGGGEVRWSRLVPVHRVVYDCNSSWIGELPPGTALPGTGTVLRVVPMLAGWPEP